MYSDKWLREDSLHKTVPIVVNSTTSIEYWENEDNQIIGACVNFELADDVHYEFMAADWEMFLKKALDVKMQADIVKPFAKFLKAQKRPHVDLETYLRENSIKFTKIAFYG